MSVHLHIRSAYTLLQSTLTIPKIIACTKQHGYQSVALTDKNVMHGAMAFYHACIKENIKPIFGMEVEAAYDNDSLGFILLAKNDQGYVDLMKLSTLLNTGEHAKQVSFEELCLYTKDCVVLTNGDQNIMETYLVKEEIGLLSKLLQLCTQSFTDFYVSIARNDSGLLKSKNPRLKSLCKEMKIRTVALSRIYFQDEAEEESYKTLCAIHQQVSVDDRMLNFSPKRYYRSQAEMAQLYEFFLNSKISMGYPVKNFYVIYAIRDLLSVCIFKQSQRCISNAWNMN